MKKKKKKVAWGTYLAAKKGSNESLEEERGDVYELYEDESFFTVCPLMRHEKSKAISYL